MWKNLREFMENFRKLLWKFRKNVREIWEEIMKNLKKIWAGFLRRFTSVFLTALWLGVSSQKFLSREMLEEKSAHDYSKLVKT